MVTDPITRRYEAALESTFETLGDGILYLRREIMEYSPEESEVDGRCQLEARAEVLCLQAAQAQKGLDLGIFPEEYILSQQKKAEKYLDRSRRIRDKLGSVNF